MNKIIKNRSLNLIRPGTLTVAAYANFYPVCYKKNNTIQGFDVDLLVKFCKKAGLEIDFIEIDEWNNLWFKPSLEEADVSIGGIGISDKRTDKNTQWTIPYFYVQRTILFSKKDPIKQFPEDITREFRGTYKSTGWIDAEDRVAKLAPEKKKFMHKGKTDDRDVKDLLSGKIQGLMRGSFVGKSLVKKHKQLQMLKPWEMDKELISSDGECFAYPCHKDSGLAVLLSAFIAVEWENGGLQRLAKKYDMA